MVVVVGREATGELEAQIRGSRHAWDVRVASVEALLRLMKLKEDTEDPQTHRQIRGILIPLEFTKIDGIIDFVFSAKEDVQHGDRDEAGRTGPEGDQTEGVPRTPPANFNDACAQRVQSSLKRPLVKRSRTLFASPDDSLKVICAVSREHEPSTTPNYWFAFHPHQRESLAETPEAFVAFGCGSAEAILLIPFADFLVWLDGLWTTQRGPDFYWHIVIYREGDRFMLHRKRGFEKVNLSAYSL